MQQVEINELYLLLIDLEVTIAERVIALFALPDPKNLHTGLFTLPNQDLSKLNTLVRKHQQETLLNTPSTTYNATHRCCEHHAVPLKGTYDVVLNHSDKRLTYYDTISRINTLLFEGHSIDSVIHQTLDEFKSVIPVIVDLYHNHNALLVYPVIKKTQGCLSYYSLDSGIIGVYFK